MLWPLLKRDPMDKENQMTEAQTQKTPPTDDNGTRRILNLSRLEYLKAEAREKFLRRQAAEREGWQGD
jgi:hypothetical protein